MQIGHNARLLASPEMAYRNVGKRLKSFIKLTDVPYGRTFWVYGYGRTAESRTRL